ncbi:GntR family transcriptional regulator [Achromobacter ruhlandii]|uniref:GntR family transcriptional regulator n=1 Tax=Achromobacter ruhlandii TaxID=72557 RepID=UPI0006C29EF0|nr:GntR family transcriptional regulator [Achromobacter ruhlandii]CUJ42802.1 Trehalose operon transcriptional repressor [Achromobacter ruhlandii]CUJ69378.1 Trehalose operon transcriptional repressor [Achromobacter ruhlandii]CUK19601.1 Trehalose operon transcriptional repressor [Achromobacter ruhlandii]
MTRSSERAPDPAAAREARGQATGPDDEAGGPRYKSIYQQLARDIGSGRYPVMTLLPTEHELCEQFGASRHTIREAIRMLTVAGMVSRRPGVGTRVETAHASTRFTQRISQFPDLLQYARNAALLVQDVRTIKLTKRLAESLGAEPGQPWLHINSIKTLGDQDTPVACTLIYADPAHSDLRADIQPRISLLRLIEDHFGNRIHEVNQEFSATPIAAGIARQLHVEPQTAGFVIPRRYYGSGGVLLLATITTFPHDKMKYSMSLNVA